MRGLRSGLTVLGVLVGLSVAADARAQSDETRAAARAAATQGIAAEESGDFSQAIELFRRAEALVHAPPHLLHIARAEANLGKLVSAQETYLKVAREELDADAPRAFVEAQVAAREELAALQPRVPSLTIVVKGGTGAVTIDGRPLPPAVIGIAFPVDPGKHELRVTADGMASEPVVVEVAEGAHERASLVLRPIAVGADVNGAPQAVDAKPARRSNIPAYAAWGVGAAGLVIGTTMMLVNRSKRDEADALCPGGACPRSRQAEIEGLDADADSAATLSWVGIGIGVVGLGVGTVLYVLNAGKPPVERTGLAGSRWIRVGGAGLEGRF